MNGRLLFMAFLGATVLLFASEAGQWYLAQGMAWWTFSALMTGGFLAWQFARAFIKELRKK